MGEDDDGGAEVGLEEVKDKYPTLSEYCAPLKAAEREIIGREREIRLLMAAMMRPELSNVILLAEAGSGKTALVQAAMVQDKDRLYLEVDLAKMIANLSNSDEMASRLKALFDEAEAYHRAERRELVLFIDEFHQVVQLSAAAVEALKPVLAASGTRGLRIIAATTYEEFRAHVSPNQPLVERLQRISLAPPDRATTVAILRGMAERYEVADQFFDDRVFESIYEYTDRYMTSQAQPRKSILLLDAMVGWHRLTGAPMDRDLLAQVLKDTANIDVAFNVDATSIKDRLNKAVLSQRLATATIAQRLQLCVADLHDKSKPISSFLFTGSTGVGKSHSNDTMIPVWTPDGSVSWKRGGDIVVGDWVFSRTGAPEEVLGVFPQGERDVYRVTLGDGRTLDVSGNHLWAVVPAKRSRAEGYTVYSTETLINKGLTTRGRDGREAMKYFIPMNEAVQWPEADLPVDPYSLGAFIANGLLTDRAALLSSDDPETVDRVGRAIGAASWEQGRDSYSWAFYTGEKTHGGRARVQLADLFAGPAAGLVGLKSAERFIPREYLSASVDQRWELVRGLFDCDGTIGQRDGDRFNVSYSTFSERLAQDVRALLFSLGVPCSVSRHEREREGRTLVEFTVHVKSRNADKHKFFALTRKKDVALRAVGVNKQREKTFDYVGIRSIERLPERKPMTCIWVDEDEHLYQAGEFIVTHNTEMTKQLARLLFGDDQAHLIRFDMSEFSNDDTFDHFRSMLTSRVWARAHSVILFDEIEKASAKVVRLLLQILDDGRLSDDNGRQVSFLNSYIIMTTNAGSEIFATIAQYNVDDSGEGKDLVKRMREIRNSISTTQGDNRFPPELLGRIDAIVPFQPLSRSTQESIVKSKMRAMRDEVMRLHGVKVEIHPDVLQYLIEDKGETDSDAGGARTAVARMTTDVTTQIAEFINKYPGERVIGVSVEGDMVSNDKNLLESDAHIVVRALQ